MMNSRPAWWAGSLCVFLGIVISGAVAIGQEPAAALSATVSKDLRKKLDDAFPGWTMAAAPACAPNAAIVSADIDFDQQADTAFLVQMPSGVIHVMVSLPRVVDKLVLHDLGPLNAVAGGTHLSVQPLGRAVRRPGTMFDDYLSGPTFAVSSCERPLVAFAWSGYGFRSVPVTAR